MQRRAHLLIAAAIVLSACGGGDDDDGSPFGDAGSETGDVGSGDESDDGGSGGLAADPIDVSGVAVPATPAARSAVVEIDGTTVEFQAIGTSGYRCTATPELIEVQMQGMNADGLTAGLFSMRAEPADGGWFGTGALEHPDVEHTDIYVDQAEIVVDGSVVTYRGPLVPRQEFGQVDAADRLGAIVIDCGTGEFVATADVGDGPITVPIGESQRFDCAYSDDRFDYEVEGGVFPDTINVSIDGRIDGDAWLGTAVVDLGDDRYVGSVSDPAATIDASAEGIDWTGEATHTSDADPSVDEQVTMSISIPCS